MFASLCKKPTALVGVEWAAQEVRLVRLKPSYPGYIVEQFAMAALPLEAMRDGKIKQFTLVQAQTAQLVEQTKSQGCLAGIALPSTEVMSQRLTLPGALTALEVEAEIATHLHHYFPTMTEELCFDFVIEGVRDAVVQEVLVVAARQELVASYMTVANQAGLVVKIVDVDTYAHQRFAGKEIAPASPPIFCQLLLAANVNVQAWQQAFARLQVCCGLAMRSMPTW